MQRLIVSLVFILGLASGASAQIGKSVPVPAGSDEDKAVAAITAAPDGPEKVALLDKFMTDYGKGDFELLADQLYVQTYLAQKNYAKVYEYGDKALALDPDNLSSAVSIVRAADAQGDMPKLFDTGEKVAAIITRFKASAAPNGVLPDQWATTKQQALTDEQADIGFVEYSLANAAFKTTDPAARTKLFERYSAAFPDSPYTINVREQTAIAYQQMQNVPKMTETAQSVLASDPNNVSMLLLLADSWSDSGQQVDKAAAYAQKALDALKDAKKPDNLTDDQWQQQTSIEQGIADSTIGEVDVIKGKNAPAVDSFKLANPLLKSSNYYYGRNLYRLGFTLAKMQKTLEARTVLTEAVSVDSPYKAKAMETLNKIGGPVSKTAPAHKKS
jgi:tetratricopeptide (TPR) repeat protein